MLFPTVEFAIFFPIVFAISWALMSRQPLWKPFILIASYVFYAAADPKFCFLLGGITVGNQIAARLLAATPDERRRTWILRIAVGLDLLVLGIFKYYAFFVQDVGDVLDTIGLGMPLPLLTILLPIGVSFFTFQAITYVVDVRRGDAEPASLIDAAIYLSFFPHLIAGPIVRASEFLPQLKEPRDPNRVAVGAGMALVALGLIKKVAIADVLARGIVDPVFAVPQAYDAPDAWMAVYAYAAQLYCDFSGYTDIAIGLALMMGFVFPQNFNNPYRATGFRDYWRRWHMTLSRFMRDYVYIPLGGNRRGNLIVIRNLMITMGLCGLWHGAAWTYVLWGLYQGVMLVSEHFIDGKVGRVTPAWFRWFATFHLTLLGYILFRSQSLDLFPTYLSRLFEPGPATLWTFPVIFGTVLVIGSHLLPEAPRERLQVWFENRNPLALATGLAAVILFVGATVPSQGVPPFIYFQF
jgi:D-alanyl-lipoteichoic acid acyltransferase DltB (MBOAT superfamily)